MLQYTYHVLSSRGILKKKGASSRAGYGNVALDHRFKENHKMSTTGRIPLTVSVGFHLSFADGRYGWTRTTAGTVMTSSCGQSSLGELKARLPGGAFTTSLRHERGACSTHFDVIFVEQPNQPYNTTRVPFFILFPG